MNKTLIFIVGLTGVGKSTTLEALKTSDINFLLLPNRRQLTDEIIISEMQRKYNLPIKPVKDRVQRFEYTKNYRKIHPSGMAYVLKTYLDSTEITQKNLIFDNLRGVNEVKGGIEYFPNASFIMLDAPEEVRLQRLVGRKDIFDQVDSKLLLENQDKELPKFKDIDSNVLASALKIINTEKENYDSVATANYLNANLNANQYLYLDTSKKTVSEITEGILKWLKTNH